MIDPERDPRPYLGELERRGLVLRFVVETHLHADFVSGGRELTAAGAQAGGIDTWRGAGRPIGTTPLLDASGADGRAVLDIRQRSEFRFGHLPGARHVELGTLTDDDAATDRVPVTPLLVHCGHGERAMSAASLLQRAGHDDVAVLAGAPDELGELEAGSGA